MRTLQIIENTVAATARHRCSLNDPCPIPHDERSTEHAPHAFSVIRISPVRASFFLQTVRAQSDSLTFHLRARTLPATFPWACSDILRLDLPSSRPAPSPPPGVFAPRVVIKMGYFSVGLPQLTFSRPGETLKNQESEGKNPQKSGSFLSWGKSDRGRKGAMRRNGRKGTVGLSSRKVGEGTEGRHRFYHERRNRKEAGEGTEGLTPFLSLGIEKNEKKKLV